MNRHLEAVRSILSGKVLLFCHHNADPDSICSAYALMELVRLLDPSVEAEIVLTAGASRLSKRVMETLNIAATTEASIDDAGVLIVLDTGTLRQLEGWGEEIASANSSIIFIDHHAPNPVTKSFADIYLVNEDATSTCEIVYEMYRSFGFTPSAGVAKALLIGIAYDSKHFSIGNVETFRAVSELLKINGSIEGVLSSFSSEMTKGERIARLKAGQRLRIFNVVGWVVASSSVNSFQASAARALIALGADVSVVVGGERGKVRASLRSSDRFHRATSVHLGMDVAAPLGEEFGGAGSGHATSAGVNGEGRPERMLKKAVEIISTMVTNKSKLAQERLIG